MNLDKTFCASKNCKNACGRKMDEQTKHLIKYVMPWRPVAFSYFCEDKEVVNVPLH